MMPVLKQPPRIRSGLECGGRVEGKMELYIFGRFLVLEGRDGDFETALREVVVATRGEAGCVEVHGYRAVRNARLYYLHSRWKDVEVFEAHAKLPHTEKFLERVEKLLEEPRDVRRCERVV
ncbi:MAG: hypothetical protein DMG52_28415 [Acidobacteria bacterium]|nr:MAG: hypothetical protein DMG52_28415 [Acidobacteriota bacterium]